MGLLDKAKDLLGKHEEKVESALDKVAEVVDEKTGGKHTDKIDKGEAMAKEQLDKRRGEQGNQPQ